MIRLHREQPLSGETAILTGEEAHYLSRVLRMGAGDRVAVFWGDGKDHIYEVVQVDRSGVQLRLISVEENRGDPHLQITLLQAMPKSGKFDDILRTVTALGVSRVVPFNAARSIGKGDDSKIARWNKIAAEASRQCGRTRIPEVAAPAKNLAAALATPGLPPGIVCWEESMRSLREVLNATQTATAITILCGPEGGLTADEVAMAQQAGLEPVSLGPRILRAELAPAAILSIIQHALGDMR